MIFPHRLLALFLWPTLNTGLLRSVRPVFPDPTADHTSEVFAVAADFDPSLALSEHGPCLVGGTITLDDACFPLKSAIHSGANALVPFGCLTLLDTGSPQTFITRDVLVRRILVEVASTACKWNCALRS